MRGTMDGFSGSFWDDIGGLGQNLINGVRQEAIGGGTALLLSQPGVKEALNQTAQEKAARSLADQLLASGKSAAQTLQENQKTIQLLTVAILGIGAYMMFFRKRRA